MNNNDVLRRIRFTFNLNDSKMIEIFASADCKVTRAEVSDWLKKDDNPDQQKLNDEQLAIFLNGFINVKRGKKEGVQPVSEKHLTNNVIFQKLKIALNLKDEDILAMLDTVGLRISKHELSAFFRNPTQSQYRPCKDQILRNFLHGMQLKYRKSEEL